MVGWLLLLWMWGSKLRSRLRMASKNVSPRSRRAFCFIASKVRHYIRAEVTIADISRMLDIDRDQLRGRLSEFAEARYIQRVSTVGENPFRGCLLDAGIGAALNWRRWEVRQVAPARMSEGVIGVVEHEHRKVR